MFFSRISRISLIIFAALVCLASFGCSHTVKPKVADFDSYEVITMGRTQYVTPHGIRAASVEPGVVRHTIAFLPDTSLIVSHYDNPPLDLRIDAEEQQRAFLRELPNGELSSVQYENRGGMDIVKVYAKGYPTEDTMIFGTMTILREAGDTMVMKIVGPAKFAGDISHLNERLCRSFTVTPPEPPKNLGPKPESDYDEKMRQASGS